MVSLMPGAFVQRLLAPKYSATTNMYRQLGAGLCIMAARALRATGRKRISLAQHQSAATSIPPGKCKVIVKAKYDSYWVE